MRHLRKLFNQRIDDRLPRLLPQFTKKRYHEVPAVTSYVCKLSDNLYFHILSAAIPKWSAFSTELCYMLNDKSPIWACKRTENDFPNEHGLCLEMPRLWTRNGSLWYVTDEEYWQTEEIVKKQVEGQGHEYRHDPGGVMFRLEEIEAWISSHPDLYPEPLSSEEKLVWPLVDHMVDKIVECGIPYFEKVAESYDCDWHATLQ